MPEKCELKLERPLEKMWFHAAMKRNFNNKCGVFKVILKPWMRLRPLGRRK